MNSEPESKQKREEIEDTDTESEAVTSMDQLSTQISQVAQDAIASPNIVAAMDAAVLPGITEVIKEYMDKQVKTLQEGITALEVALNINKERVEVAEKDILKSVAQQDMLTIGRHKNLVISGLDEKADENTSELMYELINTLQISVGSFHTK